MEHSDTLSEGQLNIDEINRTLEAYDRIMVEAQDVIEGTRNMVKKLENEMDIGMAGIITHINNNSLLNVRVNDLGEIQPCLNFDTMAFIEATMARFQNHLSWILKLQTELANAQNEVLNVSALKGILLNCRDQLETGIENTENDSPKYLENYKRECQKNRENYKNDFKKVKENYINSFEKILEKIRSQNYAALGSGFQLSLPKDTNISSTPPVEEDPDFSWVYSKKCRSFQEVWEEYKIPTLNHLSIEQLDEKYRAKWRNTNSLRKKYSRKNRVYKAMKVGLSKGYTESACYDILENARMKHNKHLGQFMDHNDFFPLELQEDSN